MPIIFSIKNSICSILTPIHFLLHTFVVSAKYVKVVFNNTFDVSEEEKESVSYKLFANEYATPRIGRPWYYPKTEIKKIAVYDKK